MSAFVLCQDSCHSHTSNCTTGIFSVTQTLGRRNTLQQSLKGQGSGIIICISVFLTHCTKASKANFWHKVTHIIFYRKQKNDHLIVGQHCDHVLRQHWKKRSSSMSVQDLHKSSVQTIMWVLNAAD